MTSPLSRRRLLALAALSGMASRADWGDVRASGTMCDPLHLAGRRFIARSRANDVSTLTVIVREHATERIAAESPRAIFTQEIESIADIEASILRVSSIAIDEPVGIDGRWTIVAGAAAVETWHRGIFFAVDRVSWSIVATWFDTRTDSALPVDLAAMVTDRYLARYPEGTPVNPDLWELLPDERDLEGAFRLHESFDRES
ncbi:MAG: hypothetical protein QM589_18010 [Thermomicrobiales bacterium]